MNDHAFWCHTCDRPADDFYACAKAGHAITDGRCPGECQFRPVPRMSGNYGRVLHQPPVAHACSPGWTRHYAEATPLNPAGWYARMPQARDYPKGTAWSCDECGAVWVSLGATRPYSPGYVEFRPERRGERRRRIRARAEALQ